MNRRDYERQLITRADGYAHSYLDGVDDRPAFPPAAAIERLSSFDEPLTDDGQPAEETVDLLHSHGSPATVGSNGPHYFGFVIGASLPAAAAAERMILAWDQCASGWVNSPIAAKLEQIASRWMLDILDLPRSSAVAFGTSATACGLGCIAAARSALLDRAGWNLMEDGLHGAPPIDVVVSETVHISLKKILRLLGFGARQITFAPVDAHGRINPAKLPSIGPRTLLCLQAGEVNTGEFDPFEALIGPARERGA
ncbi:MAG: aspartate aminotransferase family protein, partial [Myxococcota bacterium]